MTSKDGGPAFPRQPARIEHSSGDVSWFNEQDGMSLRDYFAGQALIGMFACGGHRDVAKEIAGSPEGFCLKTEQIGHAAEAQLASMAFAMADAMLTAREANRHGA